MTSSRPKPNCSEQNRMFSVNVPASTTQACIVPVVPPVNDSQTGRSGSSGTGNGSGLDVAASTATRTPSRTPRARTAQARRHIRSAASR